MCWSINYWLTFAAKVNYYLDLVKLLVALSGLCLTTK